MEHLEPLKVDARAWPQGCWCRLAVCFATWFAPLDKRDVMSNLLCALVWFSRNLDDPSAFSARTGAADNRAFLYDGNSSIP
jgi:hypothetical protein